ncbi:MAG: hypothetical protein ABW098_16350 [Candidatus Thiodiazotropha sp.]
MSTILILTVVAFVVGIIWGYKKPAGYCRMSTVQQQGFSNRLGSGIINGVVLGGIAFVVAKVILG